MEGREGIQLNDEVFMHLECYQDELKKSISKVQNE